MSVIDVRDVTLSFGAKEILKGVQWSVKAGEIATLLGPNGCGKSTLLKVITGNQKPQGGTVEILGKPLASYNGQTLAKQLAFLPQMPEAPKDMTVEELVYCGRFPHQNWWRNTAGEDRLAVEKAMQATKTEHLRGQNVVSLSGGERQRVWIAMALAQEPKILILDEPTTYLDINHQFEVMELLQQLNRKDGLTVIMVLHELNQAAAYSHHLAVLHQGHLVAQGTPKEVLSEELLSRVFRVSTRIEEQNGKPYIYMQGLLGAKP